MLEHYTQTTMMMCVVVVAQLVFICPDPCEHEQVFQRFSFFCVCVVFSVPNVEKHRHTRCTLYETNSLIFLTKMCVERSRLSHTRTYVCVARSYSRHRGKLIFSKKNGV